MSDQVHVTCPLLWIRQDDCLTWQLYLQRKHFVVELTRIRVFNNTLSRQSLTCTSAKWKLIRSSACIDKRWYKAYPKLRV